MARSTKPDARPRTVGHLPHDARARVDQRVQEILARRETAVDRARHAARQLDDDSAADADAPAPRRT